MSDIDRSDAAHWIWGFIYYNPDDPKFFVPKRFGLGYTFNFADRRTWILLGAIIAIAIVVKVMSHKAAKG